MNLHLPAVHGQTPLTSPSGSAVIEAIAQAVEVRVSKCNAELVRDLQAAARPLLTLKDVAKTLSVSLRTVETLVGTGDLRVLWVGAQRRVHPDTLASYLRSRNRLKRA
jgi:excisionase family DNA binding protein